MSQFNTITEFNNYLSDKLKNKTQLKKEVDKIKFIGNELELQFNYTLNDLLDDLTKVCNERFTDYNNYP
jgi:predicted transglutaminase-like protease